MAALFVGIGIAAVRGTPPLKKYEVDYYIIHSDLDLDVVREAAVRMARMAEVYRDRTIAFSGTIRRKLPFYLFRRYEDYLKAGGLPGSGGVFMSSKLMVAVGPGVTPATWRLIQHEGFHQFVAAVMGGDMPVWVNEGLAEYFAEAVFTGDSYVTGIVPPRRLERVRRRIAAGEFPQLRDMMVMPREQWNADLLGANYDQAWSMVHFLAHAEDGRYREPFDQFLRAVGRGRPWERAWIKHFGANVGTFEKTWRSYWTSLPGNPTAERYAEAIVAVLTSYLARASSRGQRFASVDDFFSAARANRLDAHPKDWLPASLLAKSLPWIDELGSWSLEPGPRLRCDLSNGNVLVGSFQLKSKGKRVRSVRVAVPDG